MTLYLDLIWLLNFLVDSLLLWMTSIFLKRFVSIWRIFAGGLIGSLVVFASLSPQAGYFSHPLAKLAVSVCMILAAFGWKRAKHFWAGLLTLYFATFLMGGILLGTHYFLVFDLDMQTAVFLQSLNGFGDPISWLFVILAFPVAWYFSKRRVGAVTAANIAYDVLADVKIVINGTTLKAKGMVDSGNGLLDPISKAPVMILSTVGQEEKVPEEIVQLAAEQYSALEAASSLPEAWVQKMRLIPAQSLGRKHQLLCAFKPDTITIIDREERMIQNGLVVFTGQSLSASGEFQCIIHPLMAAGGLVRSAS